MLGTPGSDARFPARCPLASLARLDPGIVLGLATESGVRQMQLGTQVETTTTTAATSYYYYYY